MPNAEPAAKAAAAAAPNPPMPGQNPGDLSTWLIYFLVTELLVPAVRQFLSFLTSNVFPTGPKPPSTQ